MEMLNYSLWFTLVWFVIIIPDFMQTNTNRKDSVQVIKAAVLFVIIIPAIAILLEYLIVRG